MSPPKPPRTRPPVTASRAHARTTAGAAICYQDLLADTCLRFRVDLAVWCTCTSRRARCACIPGWRCRSSRGCDAAHKTWTFFLKKPDEKKKLPACPPTSALGPRQATQSSNTVKHLSWQLPSAPLHLDYNNYCAKNYSAGQSLSLSHTWVSLTSSYIALLSHPPCHTHSLSLRQVCTCVLVLWLPRSRCGCTIPGVDSLQYQLIVAPPLTERASAMHTPGGRLFEQNSNSNCKPKDAVSGSQVP